MSDANFLEDCRFCSVVSKNNGEDPIGTAGTYDCWLITELPLPWTEEGLLNDPSVQPILELIKELSLGGMKIRPIAIAPDPEYSSPGYTRLLYYHRSARLFAQFEKQEYLVPNPEVTSLAIALLKQSEALSRFEAYRQNTSNIRELLVCTHGNIDVACSRFGYPIYKTLREEYAPKAEKPFRVWRCSHFGGHRFAPTLIDLPEGRYWGHLESSILDLLVQREGAVHNLRPFYRGWSGLNKLEQVVERDIWMREGWRWLNYLKAGQVLAKAETEGERNPDWAEIQIDFTDRDRGVFGSYQAKIEMSHQVTTLGDSGKEESLTVVKQYHLTHLTRNSDILI